MPFILSNSDSVPLDLIRMRFSGISLFIPCFEKIYCTHDRQQKDRLEKDGLFAVVISERCRDVRCLTRR